MADMDATSPPAETPSSLSDFYASDSPHGQPGSALAEAPDVVHPEQATATPFQDEDEDEDMDTSADMDIEDSVHSPSPEAYQNPEPESEPVPLPNALPLPGHTAVKRTLEDADLETNGDAAESSQHPHQRRKLSDQTSHIAHSTAPTDPAAVLDQKLPVELIQQVFLRLSPATLARCLRVSKKFNSILTDTKAEATSKYNQSEVRVVDSNAVWAHARKNYYPSLLPKPLATLTELQMFQLIGSGSCMVLKSDEPNGKVSPCGNVASYPPPCNSPFDRGPGPEGVRVIWAFGLVMCGECLRTNICTDIQLLQSPSAILRNGLPHIFLTLDLNYIPESQRAVSQIPKQLRAQKVYHIEDVKAIEHEYQEVKSYGEGAAEEWIKGLRTRGTERIADAARWEAFENRLAPNTSLTDVLREYDPSSFPRYHEKVKSRFVAAQPPAVGNGVSTLPQPVHGYQVAHPTPNQQYAAPSGQPGKVPRTAEDAELARQSRRDEIERRCLQLQPPISPEVLPFMPSFTNTMAIAQPLTDAGWEALRPRLLDQWDEASRKYAEHRLQVTQQRAAWSHAAAPQATQELDHLRRAREVYTAEYEQAQAPLRKKLSEYADEYYSTDWPIDLGLTANTCAAFATNCIAHVYKRYVADKRNGKLPDFGKPTDGDSEQSPTAKPFLSLDNMKWLYDNKIKPLTEIHRRELFTCSECNDPRKPKLFAFEGFIQHYGAKHTTDFSQGNIVVHWQETEWPAYPPFVVVEIPKPKRKSSNHAGNGNARKTPQGSREGPIHAPKPGMLLSENPYFSGQPQQSLQGQSYDGYPYSYAPHEGHTRGQLVPHVTPYGFPAQQTSSDESVVDASDTAQANKLSADASEVWHKLDGVKDLLSPIHVQTVIHHTTQRFSEYFRLTPTLDVVIDAMTTNASFKPMKNASGLACKKCVESQPNGSGNHPAYHERTLHAKMHTLGSLITHFKITHLPQFVPGEWTDLIALPEDKLVNTLMRTPGMDDEKLALVAAAFPRAFPTPLPAIGLITEDEDSKAGILDGGLASRLLGGTVRKGDKKKKKKGRAGSNATPPEAKDDEYDPRRPAYIKEDESAFDPARYDTDLARKASAAPPAADKFNFAPETVAALNALAARPQRERSPSVGASARPQSSSNAAPDISAILASLTGQPQAGTGAPPSTVSTSPGSAPRQPYADPYAPPPYALPSGHSSSSQYVAPPPQQPAYRAPSMPPAGYGGQDLQAVLARNAHGHEHNWGQSLVPAERASAAPPLPPRSPPRYRVVYENATGAFAEPPPPQYQLVELAPADHARGAPLEHQGGGHYAARATPTTVWVDENGRPLHLVPVDAAPAPVQYAPHPYEREWRGRYE